MCIKHPRYFIIHPKGNMIAGMLLFFLMFCCSGSSFGQSYFYLVNRFATLQGDTITYHTFLTIDAGGSGTARVRYKEPATSTDRFFELTLIDSLLPGEFNSARKYLMSADEPLPLDGTDGAGFTVPRFVFEKQEGSDDGFYYPASVDCFSNTQWHPTILEKIEEKTYEQLSKEEAFVSRFFNPSEAFYNYIFHPQLVPRDPNSSKRKEKLFLIAVANTNDKTIGVSSQKDLDNITGTFKSLSDNLGMTMVLTSIAGNGFRKGAVDSAIAKLKPSAIDIVVFYFSGHGFRYSNDTSKYPRMSLRSNQSMDRGKNNLNVEEVYRKIIKKGAKVNIVISDCCNEDIEEIAPIGRNLLRTKGWGIGTNQKINMENCTALFFPTSRINILSSSTDVNQLAIGNPTLGGFFTCFFKTELDKSLYSYESNNSWLRILLNAKEKARYQSLSAMCGQSRCVQTATIRVESTPR